MTSADRYRKWRALAFTAGLVELATILVFVLDPPPSFDLRLALFRVSVLLVPLSLGCFAAYKLERSPVLWGLSVLLYGLPFMLLAKLGPAPGPRVSYWKKRAIVRAVRGGVLPQIQSALREGFPVDTRLGWLMRRTALMEAVRAGRTEVARLLLDAGADLNARARGDETPLMLACGGGHPTTVRLLLERGADARAEAHGSSPLGASIHYGHVDVARLLLEAGARASDRVLGGTALALAQKRGNDEMVRLLQEHAEQEARLDRQKGFFQLLEPALKTGTLPRILSELAEVNLRDPRGRTPLAICAQRGHLQGAEHLLKAGADVDARDEAGRTALHAAAEGNSAAIATKLLLGGADVEAADGKGETPLLAACRHGSVAALRALLSAGGNCHARDRENVSALVLAARNGHWEVERCLLEAGATREAAYETQTAVLLNAALERSALPELLWRLQFVTEPQLRQRFASAGLLAAVRRGDHRAVDAFIQAGALVDGADRDGQTPMAIALRDGRDAVVQRLIEAGADFGGASALLDACRRGEASLARVLIQAGADVNARDASGASGLLLAARSGASELEQALLAAGAVADEAYEEFLATRAREQELERRRREREEQEAKQREAAREAERRARLERLRAVAGHQRCPRCAAGRAWFIGRALAAFSGGGGGGQPLDFAGGCERCQNYFCSSHADDGRCPFCGSALYLPGGR